MVNDTNHKLDLIDSTNDKSEGECSSDEDSCSSDSNGDYLIK